MWQKHLFGSYFKYLLKKLIEHPIADKILEMILKEDINRLDFGLKKITKDHSHVIFTNNS